MENSLQDMETILKVDCQGDLRRALLKGALSYAAIDRAVLEIWPQCNVHEATYVGKKGTDRILTEKTFKDFVSTATTTATGQVLKLQLMPPDAPSATADHVTAATATEAFSMPWQHVEQGSDAGDEGLHTVADLTDIQDGDSSPVVCSPAAACGYPQDTSAECPWEVSAAVVEEDIVDSRRESAAAQDHAKTTEGDDEFLLTDDVPPDTGFQVRADIAAEETGFQMQGDVVAGLEDANRAFEENIDIVIAAFDEDGDGYLSFLEARSLRKYAWMDQLHQHVFNQICIDVGADPKVGLDRDALTCIYSCGNSWMVLERDFEAARSKLQGVGADQHSRQRAQAAANNPVAMMMRNPLLAAPFALDAAERLRQGVANQIMVGRS